MDTTTLVCPREMDIAHAQAFKDQLLGLPKAGPVAVDVSDVCRVDGAGLQLLLAFVRMLASEGRSWSWVGRAASLEEAANRLAIADHLHFRAGEE